MKKILFWLVVSLVGAAAPAQNCNNIVTDDAHVLNAAQTAMIVSQTAKLVNEGADLHVVTAGPTDNLDLVEKNYERACPSWQSPNGGRKSTLLILMVSPTSRKVGLYYGAGLGNALDRHWNRIKSDYMVPSFRTGDWAGGFIAASEHLTSRLQNAKDETLHPAVSTTTVTHQATNLHGLWIFLLLLLMVGCICGVAIAIMKYLNRRDEEHAAQQLAIMKRSRLLALINRLKDDPGLAPELTTRLNQATENFSHLANSERTNPDTKRLTTQEYENIGNLYTEVYVTLQVGAFKTSTVPVETVQKRYKAAGAGSRSDAVATTTVTAETATVASTDIFVPVAPVVIVNSEPEFYEHPTHYETTRLDDDGGSSAFSSGGSTNDDNSGGSSSFSSDTSSSSDSGGSSSFDSGSSGSFDGGGGGGSDF